MSNPRYRNGNHRRRVRERFKKTAPVCYLCGRPIDPSLHYLDPGALVVDEVIPVSRWRQFGYESPEAVCMDDANLRPAHRKCNALKGNKVGYDPNKKKVNVIKDGNW